MSAGEGPLAGRQRRHRSAALRVVGALLGAAAVGLCARTLADSWPTVHTALAHARLRWITAVLVLSAASMVGLAVQWWAWLQATGARAAPLDACSWYLGGELGKYLPGGVWPVVGRSELAHRGGVERTRSYSSTLLSYGSMSAAAAVVCGVAGPVAAADGGPAWGWAFLPLLLAPVAMHPAVLARLTTYARRLTRGRLLVPVGSWSAALRLIAWSTPSWVLLGAASLAVTALLRVDASPAQVILAAVAAWTAGFLAVPVPAGAGVRELVFVALCGLPAATGVAVALLSRAALVLVDGLLGLAGLAVAAHRAGGRS